MMNEKTENNIKDFKQEINSNRFLKSAIYIGAGVLALFILSKALSGLTSTVRGFNELKSALNGK